MQILLARVVLKNLDYQFSTNEIAAVVAERDVEWWQNRASVLTTPQLASGYFNAGFY